MCARASLGPLEGPTQHHFSSAAGASALLARRPPRGDASTRRAVRLTVWTLTRHRPDRRMARDARGAIPCVSAASGARQKQRKGRSVHCRNRRSQLRRWTGRGTGVSGPRSRRDPAGLSIAANRTSTIAPAVKPRVAVAWCGRRVTPAKPGGGIWVTRTRRSRRRRGAPTSPGWRRPGSAPAPWTCCMTRPSSTAGA